MIRVRKFGPPVVLNDRGVPAASALGEEYDRSPEAYRTDQKRLSIDSDIYGHRTVVEALPTCQYRKCCFCERKTLGDVEHFRPKKGVRQGLGGPLLRPGYYWLAYEWNNLFLSCGPCNQRLKRDLFPLVHPERRARSHHDDVTAEEPLLLHPVDDNPEHHIGFREEVAYAINGSLRGQATIDLLRLNRPELIESRRGLLDAVIALCRVRFASERFEQNNKAIGVELPIELAEHLPKVRLALEQAILETAEFTAMTRAILSKG